MSFSTKFMGWLSFKMLNKCQFAKESQYRLHKCLLYVANLKTKSTSITLNWLERPSWLDLKKCNPAITVTLQLKFLQTSNGKLSASFEIKKTLKTTR